MTVENKQEKGFALRAFALVLILPFIFLSGCVGSAGASDYGGIMSKFSEWWGAWQAPMLSAFGIGIGIYVLAWLYASFATDDKIKVWVKAELLQIAYSAIIFVCVAILISQVQMLSATLPAITFAGNEGQAWGAWVDLSCNVPGVDRPCHIRIAEDYLQILAKATQGQATSIVRYESFLYVLSSMGLGFKGTPAPGGALSVSPFAGLTPVVETLSFAFDLLMKNLLVIRAQQFLIDFWHLAFFPFFLCAGIFFRMFYFTRKLGGLLIAIGICFYLVFPMMYVFWASVLFSFTGPWVGADATQIGLSIMQTDVNFEGVTPAVVRPVNISGIGKTISGWGQGYDGQKMIDYCANGKIEPWEQCNENADAPVVANSMSAHNGSFSCSVGKVCDTNNCVCVDDYYGAFGNEFRKYLASSANGEERIAREAQVIAGVCFEKTGTDEESAAILSKQRDAWYNRLIEAYRGGISRAFATDELLGKNGTIDNMSKLFMFSLLAPFISLMVTLSSIKVLSPTLGGDIEIAGLSRLI
ncbi:hypothetical protein COU37_02050 [Candidatus Micrarchaeota archaeon CG10_big_fil_rev_8_21_14_0_10_45_29]|nr:MAG: hypothetical protein COU37_02050 [Candidatus Micrarchaeota archaeon CG10_big_fil_rev_8_21_14_0_10_45_29]